MATQLPAKLREILETYEYFGPQGLWSDLPANSCKIRTNLYAIAKTEGVSGERQLLTEDYENIYAILIWLCKYYPRNNSSKANAGNFECPINYVDLVEPVYSASGYQFEKAILRNLIILGKNPIDKDNFFKRDLSYLSAKCADVAITDFEKSEKTKKYQDLLVFFGFFSLITVSPLIAVGAAAALPLLFALIPALLAVNAIVTFIFSKIVYPSAIVNSGEIAAKSEALVNEPAGTEVASSSAVISLALESKPKVTRVAVERSKPAAEHVVKRQPWLDGVVAGLRKPVVENVESSANSQFRKAA